MPKFYLKKFPIPLYLSAILGTVSVLTACQTTPTAPVLQRPNHVFETTGLGKSKIAAQQSAISNAKQQCGYKNPIILSDKVQYNGILDENMGRVVDRATTVVGGIFGKRTSIARDDDYEYTITFNCS